VLSAPAECATWQLRISNADLSHALFHERAHGAFFCVRRPGGRKSKNGHPWPEIYEVPAVQADKAKPAIRGRTPQKVRALLKLAKQVST
jgi:hypothetical protein